MGNYPPPPPYGGDWKYQRRVLKQQARAQRDAYRYQMRGLRRSSILGPIILIALGLVFLLVQTGRLPQHHLWDWYARFWPFLLIGAGVIMLLEWAFDHYIQSDPTQPRYRRRIGGGVFTLLILLVIAGIAAGQARLHMHGDRNFYGWNLDQNNIDEFLGDKHESDQVILSQSFPANGAFSVDNPRGDVTISGASDDNQIHVSVHKEVYTRSDSEADSKAQQLSPRLNISGNSASLTVPWLEGARADLTITVPSTAAVTVNANHGDVNISAIKAPVTVTANHGDIQLSAITGPVTTRINNSSSSLSAHSITGPVSLEGRGRDTTLSDIIGPVAMRGDYFGTTHFERIRGPIKFHTSRTDLQLVRLDGEIEISDNADLSTSDAVGPLILTTGNRNITCDRIAGDVTITNRNGSVDVTNTPPLNNVTIENRNGSVEVTLPEHASFAYQLEANNGDIESEFSEIKVPDGGLQKKILSGTVGGGGSPTPTIRISTSQGDVSLKKASIQPLPPLPPLPPRISNLPTGLPPEARQSIEDAKRAAREAERNAREAGAQARRDAKQAADEARRAAKELQQQNHNSPDQ